MVVPITNTIIRVIPKVIPMTEINDNEEKSSVASLIMALLENTS